MRVGSTGEEKRGFVCVRICMCLCVCACMGACGTHTLAALQGSVVIRGRESREGGDVIGENRKGGCTAWRREYGRRFGDFFTAVFNTFMGF